MTRRAFAFLFASFAFLGRLFGLPSPPEKKSFFPKWYVHYAKKRAKYEETPAIEILREFRQIHETRNSRKGLTEGRGSWSHCDEWVKWARGRNEFVLSEALKLKEQGIGSTFSQENEDLVRSILEPKLRAWELDHPLGAKFAFVDVSALPPIIQVDANFWTSLS